MPSSRSLIWRYYLFRVTNTSGFFLPVATIFLRDKGFGIEFIGVAYAVYAFAVLLVEVPSGYLGDWLGRRPSLAIGSGVRAVVLGVYPFLQTEAAFLAIHVFWAVGRSFRSGTEDAWLYEILQARFDESEFARTQSRGSVVELVTDAVTAILGGVLYTMNVAFPFVGTAAIAALGIPVLFTFPRIDRYGNDSGASPEETPTLTVRRALEILRLQTQRPNVRWFVLYASLFYSLFVVTRIYEQPALDTVGVPVAGFGVLYAGFKLVSALAASTVGWLTDTFDTSTIFLALIPLYGLAYLSLSLAPLLVLPVLFLNRGLNTIIGPIRNQYLNDRLDNVGRATVLSGASMVLALLGGIARLIAGWGTKQFGPVGFLPWAGVSLMLAAGVLWVLVSPVRVPDRPSRDTTAPTTTD